MSERMVHLTTVASPFHGRVLAARLGAEGILTDLRGAVSGTYPLPGLVEVWVEEPAAPLALGLLDADLAASGTTEPFATGPLATELFATEPFVTEPFVPESRATGLSDEHLGGPGAGEDFAILQAQLGGPGSGEDIAGWSVHLGGPGAGGDATDRAARASRSPRRRGTLGHPRPFGQRLTWAVAALLLAVALLSAVRLG